MKIDFSKPQKQSKMGVFVLFFYTLQKTLRISAALIVVFAVNFSKFYSKLYILIGAIVLISIVATWIRYYFFTFYIDEKSHELVIEKGFVKKTKISIQLNKIQQTNLNQTLLHKIFNLYEFQVDTAGSSKKEVEIKALTGNVAQQLKQNIIALKSPTTFAESEPVFENENKDTSANTTKEKFISISFLTLVKTGITSKYVETFAYLLIGVNTLWENGKSFKIDEKVDTSRIEQLYNYNSAVMLAVFMVLFVFVLVVIINLVRTLIKYFDFKITKTNGSLVLNFGLLTTRNISINPQKVQLINITQNFLQKKLDIANVRIEQASSSENTKQKRKDKIEIPGCSTIEKEKVFDFIYNEDFGRTEVFLPSIRKFIINCIFLIVLPIVILNTFNWYIDLLLWDKIIPLQIGYVVLGTTFAWLAFKNNKLLVTEDFVMIQSGFWDIETRIIETYKIQAVEVSQYFWQKRTNIGSIAVFTAGGNIKFSTGFYNQLVPLANNWLYKVETSDKKWM